MAAVGAVIRAGAVWDTLSLGLPYLIELLVGLVLGAVWVFHPCGESQDHYRGRLGAVKGGLFPSRFTHSLLYHFCKYLLPPRQPLDRLEAP